MTINVGDSVPQATLAVMTTDGPQQRTTEDIFAGKNVVLFALPGAFTPTCSAKHVPGYKEHAAELRAAGADTIACLSVNDAFVMGAWGEDQGVGDEVVMLADGNADFTKGVGLEMDGTKFGMGLRSQRYAMAVADGKVHKLAVEQPGEFRVSTAEHMLKLLGEDPFPNKPQR